MSYSLFDDLAWGADSESQRREASRRSIANAKHLAVRDFGDYLNGAADKEEFGERISAIRSDLADLVLRTAGKGHYKEVLEHLAWNFDKKDDDDDSDDDSDDKSDKDSDDSKDEDDKPDFVDDDDDDDKSRKESAYGQPYYDQDTNRWPFVDSPEYGDEPEGWAKSSPHNEEGTTDDFYDYGTGGHDSGTWDGTYNDTAFAGPHPATGVDPDAFDGGAVPGVKPTLTEGEGLNDGFRNPNDTNNYPPTEPQRRARRTAAPAPSIYNPAGQQAGPGMQPDLNGAGADAVLDDSQVAPTRDNVAPAAAPPGVMAHVRQGDADWDELEDWPLESPSTSVTSRKLPVVPRKSAAAGNPFAAPLQPVKNPANAVADPEGVQTVHPATALTPDAQGNPFGRPLDDPLHPSNQYKAPVSNVFANTYPKVARGKR